MNVERDIVDRLERAGVDYYITSSEALSVWAEPRQTMDIDIVTDLRASDHDAVIRPAFEDADLVNTLIEVDGRGYGGVIHRTEIVKADLISRREDPWGPATALPGPRRAAPRGDHDQPGGGVAGRDLDRFPSSRGGIVTLSIRSANGHERRFEEGAAFGARLAGVDEGDVGLPDVRPGGVVGEPRDPERDARNSSSR